nr:DUF3560 domain-containing protein [Gloeothece citriformis]
MLVGHHSEKRHRRDLKRIGNEMNKSVSHQKTAEYYKGKLHNLEHNDTISSDNPDAIALLEEKLKSLEDNQTLMKSANKIVRSKRLDHEEKITQLVGLGLPKKIAETLFTPDFCGRIGYADYRLSNNNQEIRRVKERIEILKKQQQEMIDNGGENKVQDYPHLNLKVVENFELNRIQLCFENKPPADVRKMLGNNGFRWSPGEIAWQRQLNNAGRYAVKDVIRKLEGT